MNVSKNFKKNVIDHKNQYVALSVAFYSIIDVIEDFHSGYMYNPVKPLNVIIHKEQYFSYKPYI